MKFFPRVLTAVFLLLISYTVVRAVSPIYSESEVFDNFVFLVVRPDPGAYWYFLNWGDGEIFPGLTGDASSLSAQTEDSASFVRMALFPDSTPGYYTNAEIAERNTGYASSEPGQWQPTSGHPVRYEIKARWSDQYHYDASGVAVGTSGFWLWNSPISIQSDGSFAYGYTEAFGFNFAQTGNLQSVVGLTATYVQGFVPVAKLSATVEVDMSQWNTFTVVWSQFNDAIDRLDFFVNEQPLVSRYVPTMVPLSVEIWNDNQASTFHGATFNNPESTQYMDIDSAHVEVL